MIIMDSADDDWEDCERAWIAYYRERGMIMNIEAGGKRSAACVGTTPLTAAPISGWV
jgi:hypothetical protein